MKRFLLILGGLACIVLFPGCESGGDNIVRDQVLLLDELADAYDNQASETTIDEIKKRMEANDKKLEEFHLTRDGKQKLYDRHRKEIDRATKRCADAYEQYKARKEGKPGTSK
jgi:hypothetical protein